METKDRGNDGLETLTLIMGKESAELFLQIKRDLKCIEAKYRDYFEKSRVKSGFYKDDKLSDHYLMWVDNNKFTFAFTKDSDLPEEIKEECRAIILARFNIKPGL